MAIITIVTAGYVRRVLALRGRAVVAGEARSQDLGMINRPCRIPRRRAMAVLTDICGVHMALVLA